LPETFPSVITWTLLDSRRITLVPPDHWLLVQDSHPFRAALVAPDHSPAQNVQSISVRDGHIACFAPAQTAGDAQLHLERYAEEDQQVQGAVRFLAPGEAQPLWGCGGFGTATQGSSQARNPEMEQHKVPTPHGLLKDTIPSG